VSPTRCLGYVLVGLLALQGAPALAQLDSDLDGVFDSVDNCIVVANPDQRETDGDGYGNACDNCPFHSNADQYDFDGDGRGEACAACSTSGGLPFCAQLDFTTSAPLAFNIPLADIALRPGSLWVEARPDSLPSAPTVNLTCTGANLSNPFCSDSTTGASGSDGFAEDDLEDPNSNQCGLTQSDFVSATCTLDVTPQAGESGTFRLLVDSTSQPLSADPAQMQTGSLFAFLNVNTYQFIGEQATDFRWLFGGTGAPDFGLCGPNPWDPFDEFTPVDYTAAPGPGWDCCTFDYVGQDGLVSAVGQVEVALGVDPNSPKPDPDGDGFLSACDNCSGLGIGNPFDHFNPTQADFDDDRVGDVCDNCPFVANLSQSNGDAVPAGNSCQCPDIDDDTLFDIRDVVLAYRQRNGLPLPSGVVGSRCMLGAGYDPCSEAGILGVRAALADPAIALLNNCP
jgi:hypothetical protein